MISDFALMLSSCFQILNFEFTVFGFRLSFWGIAVFTLVGGVVVWAIVKLVKS